MNTLTMEPSIPYDLTIRHKPWRPGHLRWVIQDLAGMSRQPEQDHRTRLHATLEWVCRAQDAWRNSADNGCVAAGFSFRMGWLLDDPRAWQAAMRAGHELRGLLRDDGGLAGAFDDGWMPAASDVGVTGLTQLAACWLRLAQLTQEAGWRDAAWRALAWTKRNQRTAGNALALRDALPGAVPIWTSPAAFNLETLAAKYFADTLMMDMVGMAIPPKVPEKYA